MYFIAMRMRGKEDLNHGAPIRVHVYVGLDGLRRGDEKCRAVPEVDLGEPPRPLPSSRLGRGRRHELSRFSR